MNELAFMFHCFAYITAILKYPEWNCMNPAIFTYGDLTKKLKMARNIVGFQKDISSSSFWHLTLHKTAQEILSKQYDSVDLIQFALGVNRIAILPPSKNVATDVKCYGYNVDILPFYESLTKLLKLYDHRAHKFVNALFVSGNNIITLTDKDTSAELASIILQEDK